MNDVLLPMPEIRDRCLSGRQQRLIRKAVNRRTRGWYFALGDPFAPPRLSASVGFCGFRGSSRDKYAQPDQQAIYRPKTFELQRLGGVRLMAPVWESKLHTNFTLINRLAGCVNPQTGGRTS